VGGFVAGSQALKADSAGLHRRRIHHLGGPCRAWLVCRGRSRTALIQGLFLATLGSA
jgi:hypothetical protein